MQGASSKVSTSWKKKASSGEYVGLSPDEAVSVGVAYELVAVRSGQASANTSAATADALAAAPADPVPAETLATRVPDASDIVGMEAAKAEIIQLRYALRTLLYGPPLPPLSQEDFAALTPNQRMKRDREHQLAGAAERARIDALASGGFLGLVDATAAMEVGDANNFGMPKGEKVVLDGGDEPAKMPAHLRAKLGARPQRKAAGE